MHAARLGEPAHSLAGRREPAVGMDFRHGVPHRDGTAQGLPEQRLGLALAAGEDQACPVREPDPHRQDPIAHSIGVAGDLVERPEHAGPVPGARQRVRRRQASRGVRRQRQHGTGALCGERGGCEERQGERCGQGGGGVHGDEHLRLGSRFRRH